jgi:hypothetical protein
MGMRTGPSEPGDDERGTATKARRCLELNRELLGEAREAFAERLVAAGQGGLFCKWQPGSSDDDSDTQNLVGLLDRLIEADANYPGGVESYLAGAVALLDSAGLDETQILRYQIGVKEQVLHFFPPDHAGHALLAAAATPSQPAATEDDEPRVEAETTPPSRPNLSAKAATPQAVVQRKPGARKLSRPSKQANMLNLRCWAKFWCVCLLHCSHPLLSLTREVCSCRRCRSTYTAKDKTGRIIQYGGRAIKWYLRTKNPDSLWADRLDVMASNASKGRAMFRFFRWIDDFYKFFDALTSNTGGALQVFACVSTLAKAFFILANNFYWLMSFKLAGPGAGWLTFVDPKKWKLWSARIRMVEIFSGLAVQQLVTLRCNKILAQATAADSASEADNTVSGTSTSAVGTEVASAAAGSDKTVAAARAKRRSASFRTGVYLLNIITYGDTSGLLKSIFGRSVNEG